MTSEPNTPPQPQYSKARELAARLGISHKTLFRWADAGLIHRHKVNDRVVLFDKNEVFAFVAGTKVQVQT